MCVYYVERARYYFLVAAALHPLQFCEKHSIVAYTDRVGRSFLKSRSDRRITFCRQLVNVKK